VVSGRQQDLWHDSLEEALKAVLVGVYGKGWHHKAAAAMEPTRLDPIERGAWLKNALNAERGEKLGLAEIVWILKLGRTHGYHDAMFWLADETSYQRPAPITRDDMRDALNEEANQLTDRMEMIVRELRRLKD